MKNPESVKAFGVHLRRLRESKDLSQQQLSDLADVSKRSVQRIEMGQATASNDMIVSLARALELEPKVLWEFSLPQEKK